MTGGSTWTLLFAFVSAASQSTHIIMSVIVTIITIASVGTHIMSVRDVGNHTTTIVSTTTPHIEPLTRTTATTSTATAAAASGGLRVLSFSVHSAVTTTISGLV